MSRYYPSIPLGVFYYMARPKRFNADYFSHDNDMRNHRKIRALRNKFGITGYAFWCMLLEFLTYCDYNHFHNSESEIELMAGDFGISATEITEMLNYCIKLELLSTENNYVRSKSLDGRLQGVYNKRGGNNSFLSQKLQQIADNCDRNYTTSPITVAESTQSKVKEIKVNESKEKEKKEVAFSAENAGDVSSFFEPEKSPTIPLPTEKKEKKPPAQKKEKEEPATEHWAAIVKLWHDFYRENIGHGTEDPTFTGVHTKALKNIIANIKTRNEKKGNIWDEQRAIFSFTHFLQYAYNLEWLRQNFLLPNLEKQFDKIINQHQNGTGTTAAKPRNDYSDIKRELAAELGINQSQ